jgi:hypothetical protein
MIRKMILSATLAVGALVGLAALPASAEAHPPIRHSPRFEVLVFDCGRWTCQGNYHDRFDANRAAEQFRHRGLRVRVERA